MKKRLYVYLLIIVFCIAIGGFNSYTHGILIDGGNDCDNEYEFNVLLFFNNEDDDMELVNGCLSCGDRIRVVTPTRSGYKFVGWVLDKDSNRIIDNESDLLEILNGSEMTDNGNVISKQLYAKWAPIKNDVVEKNGNNSIVIILSGLAICALVIGGTCSFIIINKRKKSNIQ